MVTTTTCPEACSTATWVTPSWVATSADAAPGGVADLVVAKWQSHSAKDAPHSQPAWSHPLAILIWRPDRPRPSSQR